MAAPDERRTDHDDDVHEDEPKTGWSSPRPSPGAMGAAHDDLFGVPSAAPREPDSDTDDDETGADAQTDVEGDAAEGRDSVTDDDDVEKRGAARQDEKGGRSVGAEETDGEGRSGATDPDGDGSRTSVG